MKKDERWSLKYLQEWHWELYVIDNGMWYSVYWKTEQWVEHFLWVFEDYKKALWVIIWFKTWLTFRAYYTCGK